jgi:ABC-type cobalamin/Fe3+-siderophores transport system ATPase subunit
MPRHVAIVGPSGCGESTMLGLLMRLHDPADGAVIIAGRDLRTVTRATLRARFGAVLQETFLFNTTVRENIRLGEPPVGGARAGLLMKTRRTRYRRLSPECCGAGSDPESRRRCPTLAPGHPGSA